MSQPTDAFGQRATDDGEHDTPVRSALLRANQALHAALDATRQFRSTHVMGRLKGEELSEYEALIDAQGVADRNRQDAHQRWRTTIAAVREDVLVADDLRHGSARGPVRAT